MSYNLADYYIYNIPLSKTYIKAFMKKNYELSLFFFYI